MTAHLRLARVPAGWRLAAAVLLVVPVPSWPDGAVTAHVPVLLPGAAELLGIGRVEDAGAALQRPFEDTIRVKLRPAGAGAPGSCAQLLEAEPAIGGASPSSDWLPLQERLAACHALQALARVGASTASALPPTLAALRDTEVWPASVWPNLSPDEARLAPGRSLAQASGGVRVWRPAVSAGPLPELELSNSGYLVRIGLLARGDFDGDQHEDWLLLWRAEAVGGSWRGVRTLVASKLPARPLLAVRSPGKD